jgi:LytR cell envelope-related transcriptional attenuator/LytR_cpsA_psr family
MDNQGRNMSGLNVRQAGCQLLNGPQALALARSRDFSYVRNGVRRWDPNGDLGRIRRQQAFLEGVLKKGLASGLTNPIRANAFIGAIVHDLTKDKGFDIGDAVRLGTRFHSFKPSDLQTFTIPTQPLMQSGSYRGEVVKQPATQQVIAKFLGLRDLTTTTRPGSSAGTPSGVAAATVVHVRNTIAVQGLAARTRDQLTRAGFRVADVGNASIRGLKVTRIAYSPGELAKAQALQATVLGTVELHEDPTLPAGEVTLLLGGSFRGVQVTGQAAAAPNSTTRSTQPPAAGTKKPSASKPTLELRDYDPRPC